MNHLISCAQFNDRSKLLKFFYEVSKIQRNQLSQKQSLFTSPFALSQSNQLYFILFYEPSTRTRFSFESAILKLGGHVVSSESASQFSSAIKGESLEDTIQVLAQYQPAGIILRHPECGAADRAAKILTKDSGISVINAGDGDGEHPTQALLDIYTIWKEFGRIDDLEIALVGDLRYGRTIHSLIILLQHAENIKLHLVSPEFLKLPEVYQSNILSRTDRIKVQTHTSLDAIPTSVDLIYMTRLQLERFNYGKQDIFKSTDSEREFNRISAEKAKEQYQAGAFSITSKFLEKLKPTARILHPLPRNNEIDHNIDRDFRAAYFRQAGNGLSVRIGLIDALPYPNEYYEPYSDYLKS